MMRNILIISKREVLRLRARFSGRTGLVMLAVLVLTMAGSYIIYHQGVSVSKGLYTLGRSADAPPILDKRFNVVELDSTTGYALLSRGAIDVFLNGNAVHDRDDERSRNAAAALRQYLEKQELVRLAAGYEIDVAFPLRVQIIEMETKKDVAATGPGLSLSELLRPTRPADAPPGTPAPGEPRRQDTGGSATPPRQSGAGAETDTAVREQLARLGEGNLLPQFKSEFVSSGSVVVPSLMKPPIPLSQVLIAFFYVVPMLFVSLFFTSSFTEEKVNRKLTVLLSAPVTGFQVIAGKMLPYIGYSIIVIVAITLMLGGSVPLGLGIFVPVALFIFSIYLMVAIMYRTFKDQTFFSVLALSAITIYLIGPAMFTGVNDLSYISPLTLAVQMYRDQPFDVTKYLLATAPLYLTFLQAMFVGTRVFKEEYLMGFRPLHTKVYEGLYLTIDKKRLSLSVFALSLSLVAPVFMAQLIFVFTSNLLMPVTLWFLMAVSVILEEMAKSIGIVALLQNKDIKSLKDVARLSVASSLGFLLGEKLLLFVALFVLSESVFVNAIFGAGLTVVPLLLHVASTSVVTLIAARWGMKHYPAAIVAGSAIHALYNLYVLRAVL